MSKVYPVGAGTYSKKPDRYPEGAPKEIIAASGAWVTDSLGDGWLVDVTSGMGAVILGHHNEEVDAEIKHQMVYGFSFPLPCVYEEQVADIIVRMLTWEKAESVRFGKNGADVTTSAVRLARAVTGRMPVAYVDYHGHHDWCMTEPPMNGGVDITWSYRIDADLDKLIDRLYAAKMRPGQVHELAAIVLEPVPSNDPSQDRSSWWGPLRKACDETGTLLILDEMVSGFRAAPGGMAQVLGIEPDLACYGKGIANGMPLSAIVGPYEYLKRYDEDVFFSLTHAGEALSLAAANATLEVIRTTPALDKIGALGKEILDIVGDRGKSGYPQRIVFDFTMEELGVLLRNGVLCAGYANLTLAHAEDQSARKVILDAFKAVMA